jgi:hypothetical protein
MKSKLDKLNELGELLKSGTITEEEFDNLKGELLNPQLGNQISSENQEIKELMDSGLISKDEYESLNKNFIKEDSQQTDTYDSSIPEEYNFNDFDENLTSSNNNRTYVFFVLIAVVFLAFFYYQNNTDSDKQQELKLDYNKTSNNSSSKNTKAKPSEANNNIEYSSNIISHLQNNSFTVNGNGNVYFSVNTKRFGENRQTGTITVNGGRANLYGEISILDDTSILVYNFKATSGSFDASINNGSSGVFHLNSSGDLYGKLSANSETKSVKFLLKR